MTVHKVSMTQLEARVERGAKHLDKVKPGWFNKVDLVTLRQSSPYAWVVAQVAGHPFTTAATWLDIHVPGAINGGFAVPVNEPYDCWYTLDTLWKEAINERIRARKYDAEVSSADEDPSNPA